jgi:PAS domain S-box-containing protein
MSPTGYSREELLGMSIQDITAPEDRYMGKNLSARLREGLLDRFDYDKRYTRRDGSCMWCHVTASSVRDAAGRFLYAIGIVEDITERKRVEAALRKSEERFRQLSVLSTVGIYQMTLTAYASIVNRTGAKCEA